MPNWAASHDSSKLCRIQCVAEMHIYYGKARSNGNWWFSRGRLVDFNQQAKARKYELDFIEPSISCHNRLVFERIRSENVRSLRQFSSSEGVADGYKDSSTKSRDQSKVEAKIVVKYSCLGNRHYVPMRNRGGRLADVDLFAGPGQYLDGTPSTPVIVLQSALKDPN